MTEDASLEQAIHEDVALRAYVPRLPAMFEAERARLLALFPASLIEVAHFGSIAVPERTLAARHRTDREAYGDAKTAFIAQVLRLP